MLQDWKLQKNEYEEVCFSQKNVCKWAKLFKEGWSSI